MKNFCLLLLGVLFYLPSFSQTGKGYVYLKNGTILKGRYTYSENQQKIRIQSAGNLWIFDASEIDSVSSKRIKTFDDLNQPLSNSKLFYRTELGVLVGNSDNSQEAPFSVTASINYALFPKFSVGGGLGIEFLKESYMPVFANVEYRFRNTASSPYIFMKAGYEFALGESNAVYYDVVPLWMSYWPWPGIGADEPLEANGGFMINPGVGYQHMFSSGFGMTFGIGYQFLRLNYSAEDDYELHIDYNRLTLKLGIIFY